MADSVCQRRRVGVVLLLILLWKFEPEMQLALHISDHFTWPAQVTEREFWRKMSVLNSTGRPPARCLLGGGAIAH
jgi:hypothetical protein